jgi:hypothetical protein
MVSALRTGIYNAAITVTGLSATNFYYSEAKQDATLPYCVLSVISNPLSWCSNNVYEEDYFQFSLYGTTLSALETIEEAIKTKFDFGHANITVSGYTVILCFRMGTPRKVKLPDSDVWQIVIEYKTRISKGR